MGEMGKTTRRPTYLVIWYQERRDNRRNLRWFRFVDGYASWPDAKKAYADRLAVGVAARVELCSALDLRLIEAWGDETAEDKWVDSKNRCASCGVSSACRYCPACEHDRSRGLRSGG